MKKFLSVHLYLEYVKHFRYGHNNLCLTNSSSVRIIDSCKQSAYSEIYHKLNIESEFISEVIRRYFFPLVFFFSSFDVKLNKKV